MLKWIASHAFLRHSVEVWKQDNRFIYVTCFIIINQLVLWNPPVNYYSISRRQGSTTSNPRHSVSRHQLSGTLCLQLGDFQGTTFKAHLKDWTVLCCIRHGLTFLLPPAPPIRTLRHTCGAANKMFFWHLTLEPVSSVSQWCVMVIVHHQFCSSRHQLLLVVMMSFQSVELLAMTSDLLVLSRHRYLSIIIIIIILLAHK